MSIEFFFTNVWMIGILIGLMSGLIVFLVTNSFYKSKTKKVHQKKIMLANQEIVHAVRPLIVNKSVLNKEYIDSLILATSQRYNLEIADVHNYKSLSNELTKEILENPFLDSESKMSYCDIVTQYKQLDRFPATEETSGESYSKIAEHNGTSFIAAISGIIGICTSLIYIIFTTQYEFELLIPWIIATILVGIGVILLLDQYRKRSKKKIIKNKPIEKDKKSK